VTAGDGAGAPARVAHAPALAGAPSIDDSYQKLIASVPAGLRPLARRLPHRLGLARTPDGGWEEFVNLHPNRELPVYAAQASTGHADGLSLSSDRVVRFIRAHHYGGFSWLLRDRVADGQVDGDPSLRQLSDVLGQRWRAALEQATGDPALTGAVIDEVTERWLRGTARERAVLGAGSADPAAYAGVVRDKLRWIAAPSDCLLRAAGSPARAHGFQRAHDLFLLGLQAIDDVNDQDEDRALYGTDMATALGCTAGALLRVAPKLVGRAAQVASEAGFSWLAFWLTAFARAIEPWHRGGDAMADELAAIAVAGAMEEGVVEPLAAPPPTGRGRVAMRVAAPR
jgi:hypothetical protein